MPWPVAEDLPISYVRLTATRHICHISHPHDQDSRQPSLLPAATLCTLVHKIACAASVDAVGLLQARRWKFMNVATAAEHLHNMHVVLQ